LQLNPPAAPAVRDVLRRVLESDTFSRSERARKLLTYLVETQQRGDSERLKGFTIAMDVFGKDADFDPSTDAVVRVQAGRLRDLLSQYYAAEGAGDPIQISIPRGGYAPSYLCVGDVPCEEASAGAVAPEPEAPAPSRRPIVIAQVKSFWAAMAAVIAMLTWIVYSTFLPAPDLPAGDHAAAADMPLATSAVAAEVSLDALPTVMVVADQDDPAVARVASVFRMALAGFDTVDLISRDHVPESGDRHMAFAFALTPGPAAGSLAIEVSNVGSGRVLTTRVFGPDDITPDHLVDRVADMLSSVAPVSGVIYGFLDQTTPGSKLVRCLLLNDEYYLGPSPAAHRAAYECFEGLVAADAKMPILYAELASLHLEAFTDRFAYPAGASADQAMALALKAVKMGPTSPSAHRSLGYVNSRTGNRQESIRWMKKAYELNTFDLSMAAAYAYALIFSGDYREGAPIMQRAVEASSAHPSWWDYGLFLAALMLDDKERAASASAPLASTRRSHYLAARLIVAKAAGNLQAAGALAAEIAQAYPKFAADPRGVFERSNYPADLTDRLVDALKDAGLSGAS